MALPSSGHNGVGVWCMYWISCSVKANDFTATKSTAPLLVIQFSQYFQIFLQAAGADDQADNVQQHHTKNNRISGDHGGCCAGGSYL